MKKPGFGLKVTAVINALLLVVGFIGCQGAFNWLTENSEPSAASQKPAETAPTQESPPPSAKSEPVFIGGTKSPFPPSLQGLVTGLTPAGTAQPFQPEPQKADQKNQSPESAKPAPTFMPSTKAIILPKEIINRLTPSGPTQPSPQDSKKDGSPPVNVSPP